MPDPRYSNGARPSDGMRPKLSCLPRHARFAAPFALIACLTSCGSSDATPPPKEMASFDASVAPPPGIPDASAPVEAGPPDATTPPPAFGAPIVVLPVDLERWVWVPIPEMRCADDTPAGIGVNFTSQSRDLVVYFQGNGVCYDEVTCKLFSSLLVGMGPDPLDHMWWGNKTVGQEGIFARNEPNNPFRKSNFVVIPHCTIDGHTADKDNTYPGGIGLVHQHGYRNVTEAFKRIVPTFADATQIVLSGYSAGGIGVTMNYHQIAAAFAAVGRPPPFFLNDAGPIMRPPYLDMSAQATLRAAWGLDATVGTFCPKCATEGLHSLYEANAKLHPGLRSAQVCAYGDVTVTALYGLLNGKLNIVQNEKIKEGLLDHAAWLASLQPSLAPSIHHSFFYDGLDHGTIYGSINSKPDLLGFVTKQLSGSTEWIDITP